MSPHDHKRDDDADFYFEDGLVVFSEKFLRERGYCCRSECRYCPYGYVRDEDE